jgi:hypothetical protein
MRVELADGYASSLPGSFENYRSLGYAASGHMKTRTPPKRGMRADDLTGSAWGLLGRRARRWSRGAWRGRVRGGRTRHGRLRRRGLRLHGRACGRPIA